jgi:hypothetical protein
MRTFRGVRDATSAGVSPAVQFVALEVVPMAVGTHLHDVTRELLMGGFQLREFLAVLDAAPVGASQCGAVDVRHEHKAPRAAHRAVGVGRLTQVSCRAEQFGLRVAHVEAVTFAGAEVAQHGPTGQRVVDVAAHGRSVGPPNPVA